ncbi:MAG: RNA polymerase sigma factor [Bacteroidales bacterium]|nr:RNA polymerase sigma factor [Bacteroidales bacterium]
MKLKIKDRDIVAGCKADKPQSQELLYHQYSRLVMGIALRYTQNETDAEDIVQEVFIKIFTNINSLRDPDSLMAWIKTISTKTCLDFLKAKNKGLVTTSLDEITHEINDEKNALYDGIPTEKLLEFIQSLPDGYRTVFNLCAIDGYSYEEVAAMLGCSTSNVRSQYFRAKKQLKEKIENYE